MKKYIILLVLNLSIAPFVLFAEEPAHDDKEHEEAESNLDHEHWEKAHGSGVPDKPERGLGVIEKPEKVEVDSAQE